VLSSGSRMCETLRLRRLRMRGCHDERRRACIGSFFPRHNRQFKTFARRRNSSLFSVSGAQFGCCRTETRLADGMMLRSKDLPRQRSKLFIDQGRRSRPLASEGVAKLASLAIMATMAAPPTFPKSQRRIDYVTSSYRRLPVTKAIPHSFPRWRSAWHPRRRRNRAQQPASGARTRHPRGSGASIW
jgi:hypothetical protein